ncbi:MAG: hypothetical protein IPF74_13585 [Rhodocyclaceae bacterium]|nr:hypothetical protein [Rhodocyclaceae bacterium]
MRRLPPELARRCVALAGAHGVVRAPAYVDGLPRILGVRVLINAPFYVVAGLADEGGRGGATAGGRPGRPAVAGGALAYARPAQPARARARSTRLSRRRND